MKNELTQRLAPLVVATLLLAFVPLATSDYVLHIAIEILLWGFVYTAWSLMGKTSSARWQNPGANAERRRA